MLRSAALVPAAQSVYAVVQRLLAENFAIFCLHFGRRVGEELAAPLAWPRQRLFFLRFGGSKLRGFREDATGTQKSHSTVLTSIKEVESSRLQCLSDVRGRKKEQVQHMRASKVQ